MGLNPIGLVSLWEEMIKSRKPQTWAHTEGRPCEDTGRRQPSVCQGEGPQKDPNLLAPCSWTSSLQNCEHVYCCCLNHAVSGTLLWQFEQTNLQVLRSPEAGLAWWVRERGSWIEIEPGLWGAKLRASALQRTEGSSCRSPSRESRILSYSSTGQRQGLSRFSQAISLSNVLSQKWEREEWVLVNG